MTFGEPDLLWCLLTLPLLAALIVHNDRRRQKRLEQLVAVRLLPELTDPIARLQTLIKQALFLAALAAFVLALARPQLGSVEQNFEQHGRDIVLAIDTSKSMLSTDYAPNRLTRAKLAAQDILDSMKGDRIGLIAFAGTAQVEAPLTTDYQTVLDAITQLDTKTVERGGTDITSAIHSAELALGRSEGSYRALVLLTDGEDLEENAIAAAKDAASYGIRIFTVGIGTKEGALIPVDPDRQELLRDRDGQTVRSRLDESRLRAIAEQTGAFYVHLENGTMSRLIDSGLRKLGEGKIDDRSTRIPVERYRWPLIFGMLLLLLSAALNDRRKKQGQARRTPVPGAVALVILASMLNANANPGLDHYNQGDFDKALENFREELKHDPDSPTINFNLGDANYRLQKYDEAFEAYSKAMMSNDPALQEKAYYNAGNSLFMEGNHAQDLEQQLSNYYDARYQYNQALNRNSEDEQAKKNLRLLEERIKDAEKQKEEEQQRQQKQQRQRRKPKSRNHNQQQEGQKGQKPDRQSDPGSDGTDPDDQQTPGDQQLGPSDQNQSGADDQPQDEPPSPKKDGQLREITPSEEQKQQMQQLQESKPGMMSEDEALGLLDSLKDESDKIDLMHRKTDRGVLRDW
jgi:Ca-activated chloride channel family protein